MPVYVQKKFVHTTTDTESKLFKTATTLSMDDNKTYEGTKPESKYNQQIYGISCGTLAITVATTVNSADILEIEKQQTITQFPNTVLIKSEIDMEYFVEPQDGLNNLIQNNTQLIGKKYDTIKHKSIVNMTPYDIQKADNGGCEYSITLYDGRRYIMTPNEVEALTIRYLYRNHIKSNKDAAVLKVTMTRPVGFGAQQTQSRFNHRM